MKNPRRSLPFVVNHWIKRVFVILFLWFIGVGTYIIHIGYRDQAAPADVIIVLGAAAYDAKPSPVFEQRLRHGIDLYQQGLARKIVFTGGYGGIKARFSESQVARRYAVLHGIPYQAILIETKSKNTRENLIEAQRLMQEYQLKKAIIVSDPLHISRALRLSNELNIDALGSATPSTRFRSVSTNLPFLLQEIYFFHRDWLLRFFSLFKELNR